MNRASVINAFYIVKVIFLALVMKIYIEQGLNVMNTPKCITKVGVKLGGVRGDKYHLLKLFASHTSG